MGINNNFVEVKNDKSYLYKTVFNPIIEYPQDGTPVPGISGCFIKYNEQEASMVGSDKKIYKIKARGVYLLV